MIPNEILRYMINFMSYYLSKAKNGTATVYTMAGGTGELRRKRRKEHLGKKEEELILQKT